MTNLPNVLPCPFCKHVGIDIVEGSTFRWRLPECENCGATCGEVRHDTMADDRAQAEIETHQRCVEAWNTRAIDRDEVVRLLDYVIEIVAVEGDVSVPKSDLLAAIGIKE